MLTLNLGQKAVFVLRALVTLSLLGLLLTEISWDETAAALSRAQLPLLLAAFLAMTLTRLLMPFKWGLLLQAQQIQISWPVLTRLYYMASFFGQVLPATVGADALRVCWLSRRSLSLSAILSSIVCERFIGLLVIAALALTGLLLLGCSNTALTPQLFWLVLGLLVGALALTLLSLSTMVSRRVLEYLARFSDRRPLAWLRHPAAFYQAILNYRAQRKLIIGFFILTVVETLLAGAAALAVMLALGLDAPLLYMLAFLPVQFLLIRLPISLAGWGLHELGFVYFLSLAGVPAPLGLAVGLTHHLLQLAALSPALYFLLAKSQPFTWPSRKVGAEAWQPGGPV